MPNEDENPRWFNIEANAKAKHADIYLYGIVGSWRVNIQNFMEEIKQYKNLTSINVFISTLGGTFLDGLPIYNMLKQHKAHVTTINMGYAISMGSVIMLAGDTRKSAQNALQMLHEANTVVCDYVNADDLRKHITRLDAHTDAILPRYQEVLQISASAARATLKKETWYNADQALNAGLIHEIIDPVNLDDIEEEMTEDHWREIVKMAGKQPPKEFVNHLCNHLPEAKAHFDDIKEQAKQHQAQDEDMTPEQLEELKTSMATAITTAIDTGLQGISAKFEALPQALQPSFAEQKATADTISTAITAGFDKVTQSLKDNADKSDAAFATLKEDQGKQTESLNSVTAKLDGIKKLPVNKQNIDEHGNADDDDSEERYA